MSDARLSKYIMSDSIKQMLIKMSKNRGETLDNLIERVKNVETDETITDELKDKTLEYLRLNYAKELTRDQLWPRNQSE